MSRGISLNEIHRRSGVSYPALLRYRDRMLFPCGEKGGELCGPLAKFTEVRGDRYYFDPASIPLFLREKRAGLAKRGRPPQPKKGAR